MKLAILFVLMLFAGILLITAEVNKANNAKNFYQYEEQLNSDYVCSQSLQIVEDYNLPDTCISDLQIYNLTEIETETLN